MEWFSFLCDEVALFPVKDLFRIIMARSRSVPDEMPLAAQFDLETDIQLSSVSIGGQPLCNLRFADNIDMLGGSEEEVQQQLTERLDKTAGGHGMEISLEKSKILVHTIWMNGKTLEEADQFKYLGSTHRRNINKGSSDQTGTSTPSHDKVTNTMEKHHQFYNSGW